MSGISSLFAIGETLLDESPDPISRCLESAGRFLSSTTANEMLEAALSSTANRQSIADMVLGLDHVGFIAPEEELSSVSSSAVAAGFSVSHWTFPSTIMSRELGELAGCDQLPITVFKACGPTSERTSRVVEVFMPSGVEPRRVREWIRLGIGVHVAFSISQPSCFSDIAQIMTEEGFRLPPFMQSAPPKNAAEGLTILYFDGHLRARPLRLEFCHYA